MIPDCEYFDKCWILTFEAEMLNRKLFSHYCDSLERAWHGVDGVWGLKTQSSFPQYPANGLPEDDSPWMRSLSKAFKIRCKAEIHCHEWVNAPSQPSISIYIMFLIKHMGLADLYFLCLPKLIGAMPFTVIKSHSPTSSLRDVRHPPTRMERIDPWRIIRIHPVVFYSRALCQTALNLSPEEVHDRMKPHCQDIRLIADGVLALVTDQELSAQASDEMSNRILVALGRSPVEYDDTPYRQKTP